ncbi:MAG: Ldh family oxidoreductase [Chloroflexi bacterium]|nr:Ldh family oxidoreductase [Chloroflexota bacterium]
MLTLSAGLLNRTTSAIFEAAGTPSDIATFMASSLVGANLAGHDSHGVIQIAGYMNLIRNGSLLPAARPEVTKEGPAVIQVDGAWGFGQYTAHTCMDLAIQKAKQNQLGLVTTTRVSHIGRLGEWAEQAANAGVIGMLGVSWGAGPYAGTPHGGAARVLSTNPISFGIPLKDRPPFVLDFATTAVAEGKLRVARAKGVPVPDGWIVDAQGRPTNDVEQFYTGGGMLQPFGGHKGYALALAIELLSIALTGAEVPPDERGRKNGAFFLAIDPTAIRSIEDFVAEATAICERVTNVPLAPGSSGVLVPGQPEDTNRRKRQAEGIELAESTWEEIQGIATELGAKV